MEDYHIKQEQKTTNMLKILKIIIKSWNDYWIEYDKWWDKLTIEEKLWLMMINQRDKLI